MEITDSLVFPVTDGHVISFSIWAIHTYGTYDSYLGAFKAPALDTYIRTHILPLEMKSVLRETEPYIGVKHVDIHISRLQRYRKLILDKIKYMKGKLGKLAFPIEAAEIRRVKREAALIRRQVQEAREMQQRQYYAEYAREVLLRLEIAPISIVTKQLTKEEVVMEDNCVICMDTHKMTDACTTNCGHQFGRACLTKWTNLGHSTGRTRCPICRTAVTEMTQYIELSLLDQVVLV